MRAARGAREPPAFGGVAGQTESVGIDERGDVEGRKPGGGTKPGGMKPGCCVTGEAALPPEWSGGRCPETEPHEGAALGGDRFCAGRRARSARAARVRAARLGAARRGAARAGAHEALRHDLVGLLVENGPVRRRPHPPCARRPR